jgi:CheY-like chemotaxis protein
MASANSAAGASAFVAPDLRDKAVMLVAPQAIEASLVARRLERWGAQTCSLTDAVVAQALLPERAWHAIIVDHNLGAEEAEQLAEAARYHALHRIVMVTPSTRRERQPSESSAFTGYLVKPLRAASLAARLVMPDVTDAPKLVVDDADPVEAAPRPAPSRGLSILVAEDNEINALLMRSLLTRLGHRPVITVNGAQAMESWLAAETAGAPYDLVLMDVQMPELDGIETTRRIRARETSLQMRRTPIIALTANTLVEDRYACFAAGMDGFLVKPLDRDKLNEVLASIPASPHLAAQVGRF